MRAVRYRFTAELRNRGRSWVAVALLAGLFYGSVVAATAGARRTDTVVARSIGNKLTPDIFTVPAYSPNGELLRFDEMARFPEVARSFRVPMFLNRDGFDVDGFADLSLGTQAGKLLDGRLPGPAATDEATVNFVAREKKHVHVGDTVALHLAGPGYSGDGDFPPGPEAKVKIVGVTAALGDFASVAGPGLAVTQAFIDTFKDRASSTELYMFVLKRKSADLPDFRRHVSQMTGGKPALIVEGRNDWAQIQHSFHVQAVALWILAGFLGLVTMLVFTQTLARLAWLESADHQTLFALGMPRTERLALAALRGLFIGAIAAGVGAVLAVCVSGLMPFGRPRMAETSPGLSAPVVFVLGGFAVTLVAVLLQSTLPTIIQRRGRRARPSRVADLAAAGPSASASVGLRLALEPGRGADAVPVRSALVGTTIGVLAVVMSLTVSSSLAHLLHTPRLYGWGWDVSADLSQAGPDASAKLAAMPGVAAVGSGNLGTQVSVGTITAELVAMEAGPVEPVLLEGRRPEGSDEVALGRKTLRAAHTRIGSVVPVALSGQNAERRMRVVGVAVLPVESDVSTIGEGVLITGAGLRAFVPDVKPDVAFVRFAPGADRPRLLRDVAGLAGGADRIRAPTKPSTLVDFGRVRSLPLVLAGLLACLALATIAHVLVSSVRRRRKDLAVLKTMGFVSRDIRAVVAWQAVALVVLSLAIGIPLGVAAGRAVWGVFARYGGFVSEAVTDVLPLVAVSVGALALALMAASLAGRTAARTRPATVLRSE
jgi:ABC-type lipoprotein release transport system permease subunit